jgi:hypothetical protein
LILILFLILGNFLKIDTVSSSVSKLKITSDVEKESEYGFIYSVSGPVVVAENMSGSAMYELVIFEGLKKIAIFITSLLLLGSCWS